MNAVRALTDTLNSWLLDAVEYMRPAAIQRRHNERVLADMREELRRLPMDAQRALLDAKRVLEAREKEIRDLARLREIDLTYHIKRAEHLLGND
jgi:hypothetical protein